MSRELEIALAFYLKHKLYGMELATQSTQDHKDKVYDNLVDWMKREGING